MDKKEKKTIKIGIFVGSLGSFIVLGIMVLVIVLYFVSPGAYSVTTARYNKGTAEDQQNVLTALGTENTEEDFELYFQWYNVIHELGHGLLIYNSNIKIGSAAEEQLVNDFAVAYWTAYGEKDKLERLRKITEYASNNIKSDANGESYMDFARNNWGKSSFFTFNNYGWFQFTSTNEALKGGKTLPQVLDEMGITGYALPDSFETLIYSDVNEEVSTQILNDAAANFNSWGLKFPPVHHSFSNDPNSNFSRPVKDLWLFDFPDITAG